MKKARSIEGRWWIFGDDKPAHFGTLLFDPEKKLELKVSIPYEREHIDFMRSLGEDMDEMPEVIHGADEHNNPITLFGCSWSKSLTTNLDRFAIYSLAAVLGCRAESWNEPRFPVACICYSALGRWMGRRVLHDSKVEGKLWNAYLNMGNSYDFTLSQGFRIKLESVGAPEVSISKFGMELHHRIWFFFDEPRTLQEIRENYGSVFLRLLCLLTGERVYIENLTCHDSDPFDPVKAQRSKSVELLYRNPGITKERKEVLAPHMIASFLDVEQTAGVVLQKWYDCDERLRPVLDLYFAILAGHAQSIQSRFLFAAQALEVYHARSAQFTSTDLPTQAHKDRVKAIIEVTPTAFKSWLQEKLCFMNQKTLAQRLSDIFQLHSVEVARMTVGINDFPDKVRHTRNYFTHYSEDLRRSGKVAEGDELIRMTFVIEDLLKICLLKAIEIQGKPIERIIENGFPVNIISLQSKDSAGSQQGKDL